MTTNALLYGNERAEGQSILNDGLGARPITCDQVAWILDVFERYLPPSKHVRVSQEREMMKHGMLYEVMEVAGLKFADDAARWNGTPNSARKHSKGEKAPNAEITGSACGVRVD